MLVSLKLKRVIILCLFCTVLFAFSATPNVVFADKENLLTGEEERFTDLLHSRIAELQQTVDELIPLLNREYHSQDQVLISLDDVNDIFSKSKPCRIADFPKEMKGLREFWNTDICNNYLKLKQSVPLYFDTRAYNPDSTLVQIYKKNQH